MLDGWRREDGRSFLRQPVRGSARRRGETRQEAANQHKAGTTVHLSEYNDRSHLF
jgi:hypothetical protein